MQVRRGHRSALQAADDAPTARGVALPHTWGVGARADLGVHRRPAAGGQAGARQAPQVARLWCKSSCVQIFAYQTLQILVAAALSGILMAGLPS